MRKYEEILDIEFGRSFNTYSVHEVSGAKVKLRESGNVSITEVELEEENDYNRPAGKYYTYSVKQFTLKEAKIIVEEMSMGIKGLLPKKLKRVMIFGMGNNLLISDSLGEKVLKDIDILNFKGIKLGKFLPDVITNSGVESKDVVTAITKIFKPDVVLIIDSLCARDFKKLGRSFQISSSGIVPGSGVGNFKCVLNQDTLGCPVIAVGVPLVVYLNSIILDVVSKIKPLTQVELEALNEINDMFDGIFTPKDVDIMVENSAEIVREAVLMALK